MSARVRPVPVLAWAWVVFGAGWIRAAVQFFRLVGHAGGPGSGGLLLLVPLFVALLPVGVGAMLLGWRLGRGGAAARRAAQVLSIVGLVGFGLSLVPPMVIVTAIAVAMLFEGGVVAGVAALAGAPVLYVVTLVLLRVTRERERAPVGHGPLLGGAALLGALAVLFPAVKLPDRYAQREADAAAVQQAIDADDVERVKRLPAEKVVLQLPEGAAQPSGDALGYAVATHKRRVALALIPTWRATWIQQAAAEAVVAGDADVRAALAARRVDWTTDDVIWGALRSGRREPLEFLLSKGVPMARLWCASEEAYLPGVQQQLTALGAKDLRCAKP